MSLTFDGKTLTSMICDPDNLDDITLYSHHRLEHVAEVKKLKGWLNENLMKMFIARAEGLFIWVSVVASFLENISCQDQSQFATLPSRLSL
jgi:hypothetical protein